MKVNKLISMDVELAEKLKGEENASKLVNKLIEDYYNSLEDPYKNMSVKEMESELKKIEILKKASEEIKDLKEAENE